MSKSEYAGFSRYQLFIYHSTLLLLKGIVQEEKEIESDNYDEDGNRTNKYDDNRNVDLILEGLRDVAIFKYDSRPRYSRTFAYVYRNRTDHTIYFGGALSRAGNEGNDTLSGVFIHEVSHKTIGTTDVQLPNGITAYGTSLVQSLDASNKIIKHRYCCKRISA